MNIIAHRGYSDLAPENTLPSFDLAIEKGFNIFELDIQLTKDKVPIVFHDYDLDRICGLNLKINEIEFNSIEDFRHIATQKVSPRRASGIPNTAAS